MSTPKQVQPEQSLSVTVDDMPADQLGPGVQARTLPGMPGIRTWVIDLEPGAEWPELDVHNGYGEAYFIVHGEIIEGSTTYGPGTYIAFGPATSHRPRSETGARVFGFNYDA